MSSGLLPVVRRVVPGVGRVHAQVEPLAQAWREANAAALLASGPLWIALGDSMSQGVGAGSTSAGWVGQLHAQLGERGRPMRVVNLSVTGARVHDLLADQIPRLHDLGVQPSLVTVLIGANDMLTRRRRIPAVTDFATVLAELAGLADAELVVGTLPRRNREALAINALIEEYAATGRVRIADLRGRPSLRGLREGLAEDWFHPNDRGYAGISAAFARALDLPVTPPAA